MSAFSAPDVDVEHRTMVTVRAPGRLHLGFLDPSGSLGRRFGSLGLVIDGPVTELTVGPAAADEFIAATSGARAELERARGHVERMREHTGRREPLRLSIAQALPAHAGLGSGTQLALAVGRAFARWQRLDVPTAVLAAWLGRGLRSGVGIAGFDDGGLLLDGGPSRAGVPAALLSRIAPPAAWRVVLVQDHRIRGLSGAGEKTAIATLAALPRSAAADICHQVLMRILPGAADGEFEPFAAGINDIQRLLGQHFAPAQGGRAFTSEAVERAVRAVAGAAPVTAAIGQSSWGPTGFAILPSEALARTALDAARAAGAVDAALDVRIVAARHCGATVHDARTA
jgi:beta-ribofuranosylaminobenzene 5'-phosphate synthase